MSLYKPHNEKTNNLHMRKQRRRSAAPLFSLSVTIFFACTARFVSNLFGNHIVGFLFTRLLDTLYQENGQLFPYRLSYDQRQIFVSPVFGGFLSKLYPWLYSTFSKICWSYSFGKHIPFYHSMPQNSVISKTLYHLQKS